MEMFKFTEGDRVKITDHTLWYNGYIGEVMQCFYHEFRNNLSISKEVIPSYEYKVRVVNGERDDLFVILKQDQITFMGDSKKGDFKKTEENEEEEQPSAFSIIQEAADCLKNRASERDKPDGERSMKATIGMFEHATGVKLSEEQGWLFMVCLKIARSQGGGFKLDDFIDMTAYAALSGEAANNERNNNG